MFAHRCRIIGRQWRQQCTIHLQYTFNVRCQNWQNRPFSRVFLPYFQKTPFFLFWIDFTPLFAYTRVYALVSKKHPFIRVFLFTHGYQSRTRVAPPGFSPILTPPKMSFLEQLKIPYYVFVCYLILRWIKHNLICVKMLVGHVESIVNALFIMVSKVFMPPLTSTFLR